ncbi:DUF6215 domain-containing protein [Streptomyces sp. NPDC047981]|uniref:DUF6215 domain-containing protein n=1 Tax=Streptomyces sp. NPDC047981 TaxID=3154610 RepID=UPI003439C6E0
MADDIEGLPKGSGVWGQVVAGLLLVPALGAALWALGEVTGTSGTAGGERRPAACSDDADATQPTAQPTPPVTGAAKSADSADAAAERRLTGHQLCLALNRPDLARLLGTPEETATSASGSDASLKLAGGSLADLSTPTSQVEFETYTVSLAVTYDRLPVKGSEAGLVWDDARPRSVLGRPAVVHSEATVAVSFRLDGSDAYTGTGAPARVLSVAKDARDSGGSFELAIWREDGTAPDDAVLLRVAEQVLPTIPGW